MRLSTCTAAIATATLFLSSLASPTPNTNSLAGVSSANRIEERKDKKKPDTKYFHEPGGSNTLGHYDKRYFKGVVSDEERTDTQKHMIRAYLNFFRENDLDTWIAHGTLLGWWWNGKRLPWDFDLDTQVSDATLQHLGKVHNQTKYPYVSYDGTVQREYLLDVNPWIWERERGDGANIIDARWIDMRNGLFIDITGLAETHPDDRPGEWVCKNYHRYQTTELYPMRETMFEGVVAKVPYNYDKILVDEYKEKALTVTEFHGHRWDAEKREWVKSEEVERKEAEERKKAQEEEARKNGEKAKLDS
ncbi:mannosylphosphate transferase [Stemphylium lycopersici]|uniref:Mannosylphosphate transferase n=1 Tax=Stemphylium lycopersici TaxID=183478 RepID=A0A364N7H0_STELY|nr:mannosylphosphate transferase [Stemphylium lycopersici]RAR13202.1 mannosylphosphate transferase [Stemphylium lycopersici]